MNQDWPIAFQLEFVGGHEDVHYDTWVLAGDH